MSGTVIFQQYNPSISILTLNRPEKRNALTIELMESLAAEIDRLQSQSTCRVVIIRGAGDVFCAGLDLVEAVETEVAERSAQRVAETFKCVSASPLITIAAAQGVAYAGGAGLMSACDLVVAADDLKICFPEVRRGLLPALVTTVLGGRLRDSEMLELFLLAEPIDAARAFQLGLVHRIVPGERLVDAAIGIAETVCKGGPETVRQTKKLVRQIAFRAGEESLATALAMHTRARASDEAAEGLAAFRERREPNW